MPINHNIQVPITTGRPLHVRSRTLTAMATPTTYLPDLSGSHHGSGRHQQPIVGQIVTQKAQAYLWEVGVCQAGQQVWGLAGEREEAHSVAGRKCLLQRQHPLHCRGALHLIPQSLQRRCAAV